MRLLVASLAAQGSTARLEWGYCADYIRTGVGSPEQLAHAMAGTKWLFDNTDYASRSRDYTLKCGEVSCIMHISSVISRSSGDVFVVILQTACVQHVSQKKPSKTHITSKVSFPVAS